MISLELLELDIQCQNLTGLTLQLLAHLGNVIGAIVALALITLVVTPFSHKPKLPKLVPLGIDQLGILFPRVVPIGDSYLASALTTPLALTAAICSSEGSSDCHRKSL